MVDKKQSTYDRILCLMLPLIASIVSSFEFFSIFSTNVLIKAIIVGSVIGVLEAFIVIQFNLSIQIRFVLFILGFIIFSGLIMNNSISGIFPSVTSTKDLINLVGTGWSEIVTSATPPADTSNLIVIPYLCTYSSAVFMSLLLNKFRIKIVGLIPPYCVLIIGILLGTSAPVSIVTKALPLLAVSYGVIFFQRQSSRIEFIGKRSNLTLIGLMGIILVASLASYFLVGIILPSSQRFVLRNKVQPPFNLASYPSPLAGYRNYAITQKQDVLFNVSGVQKGDRIALATMNSYNGIVWQVGDGTSEYGTFSHPGIVINQEACPSSLGCRHETIIVKDLGYTGIWLPRVGIVNSIGFGGPRAYELLSTLEYNSTTQAMATPIYLVPGDSYSLKITDPILPNVNHVKSSSLVNSGPTNITGVPQVVQTKAQTIAAGSATDFQKMETMAQNLNQNGVYSDGLPNQPVSVAGSGAYRMAEFFQGQPVGDAEQYCSALALMANSLGIPSRVVMGAVASNSGTDVIKGSDITAWVEVDFQNIGWYPFFPTPPKNSTKQPQSPPLPSASAVTPEIGSNLNSNNTSSAANQNGKSNIIKHKKTLNSGSDLIGIVATDLGLSSPLIIVILIILFIILYKERRKVNRKTRGTPVEKILNGWLEIQDSVTDFGITLSTGGTRKIHSRELGIKDPGVVMIADKATFGAEEPSLSEVDEFWQRVELVLKDVKDKHKMFEKIKAKLSLKSIRKSKLQS